MLRAPLCLSVLTTLACPLAIACSPATTPPPPSHAADTNRATQASSAAATTPPRPAEPAAPAIRVELREGHPAGELAGIANTPEGIVSAGRDGIVIAWDVTERIARARTTIDGEIVGIAGHSKHKAVAIATKDGRIFRWEPNAAPTQLTRLEQPLKRIAASADLSVLLVSMAESAAVIDGQNGTIIRDVPFRADVHGIDISADGERIAVGYGPGKLYAGLAKRKVELLDRRSQPFVNMSNATEYGSYETLKWDPTGEKLAALAKPNFEVWNLQKGQSRREIDYFLSANSYGAAAWAPNGASIALSAREYVSYLHVVSFDKNKATEPVPSVKMADTFINGAIFVHDKLVAVSGDGGDIDLRDVPSLQRAGQLRSHDGRVSGLTWDPKGERIAWLSRNKRLLVLDTQKLIFTLDQTGYEFNSADQDLALAFDTTGQFLFVPRFMPSPGAVNNARIFDSFTGKLVGKLDDTYSTLGVASNGRVLTTWRGQGPKVVTVQMEDGKTKIAPMIAGSKDESSKDTVIADDRSGRAVVFPSNRPGADLVIMPEQGDSTTIALLGAAWPAAMRGATIVTGSRANPQEILRFDDKGQPGAPFKIDCPPKAMTISTDRKWLAVACQADAGLRVLSLEDGHEVFRDNTERMTALAFHPNAPVLAAGGNTLRLFRLDRLGRHDDRVTIHYVDCKDQAYPVVVGKTALDAADGANAALIIHEADGAKVARTLADVRKSGLLSHILEP